MGKMSAIEKVKCALKSQDGKILTENFISLTLLKAIGYIFPLITLPYLARVIGVSSFGEIAFVASIMIYIETLTDFGFNYTATRDIARNRDNHEIVSKIFSNVLTTRVILMIFSAILLAICTFYIPFLSDKKALIWFTFLYIPGHIMFPEWYFQAIERMKYITIINIISKLIFTVLIFLVIKQKSDYIYQPLLIASGFFVSGCIAMLLIFCKFNVRYILPTRREIFCTLKSGWSMFVVLFLPNLYNSFSTILLRVCSGAGAVGIYSEGNKFISLSDQLSQVLSRTFYPFLARRIDKHSLYVKISASISIIASITLFIVADLLIKIFYTSEFEDSATIIKILAICPFFLFLSNTYGVNYLVIIGKENVCRKITTYCSLAGFLLAIALVPKYGYVGVAVMLVLVRGALGVLTYYYARKYRVRSQDLNIT